MSGSNSEKLCEQKRSDFSIEHILTRAGNKNNTCAENGNDGFAFSWLQCTRYCPPKLPRTQKKEGPQKRQLGRHPRIPFSSQQLAVLEEKFKHSPYLSSAEVTHLSRSLQLADIRVKIWFQNRRARERREKQEKEVQQLKPYTKEKITENSFTAEPVSNTTEQSIFCNRQFATNTFVPLPITYENTSRYFVHQS